MSIKITLTEEQVTDVLDNDSDLKYQLFRDATGPDLITEESTFPNRLKFYMDKQGVTAKDVVDFFKIKYPFLAKSTSSIQHYINGVRTPRLSAVFALADFLDIAPALLLPAKPGKYIEYKGDHVEMITPEVIDEPDQDPEEVTELIPGTLDALNDLTDISASENNNVVVSDQVTSESVEDTTTQDESSTSEEDVNIYEDHNVVIEEEDYIENDPQINKSLDAESQDEIKPQTSLEIEEDDFDTSSSSDEVKSADDFLRDLFSNPGSTPYDEYTKGKE